MDFTIRQEKFEGPLELLLDLIEKEKLSISEISLSEVTDEYVRHVKAMVKLDPEALAEFLVVAAQLLLIKSRSLLPTLEFSEEEKISIEELERRLAEYGRIREVVKDLRNLEKARRIIVTREGFLGVEPVFYPPPKLSLDMLRASFVMFLAALPKLEKLVEEKIKKILSLEERIKHIREFLQGSVERAFSEIVRGSTEKVDIIVSFLAILELSKQRLVDLHQKTPFEDITIKKSPKSRLRPFA